MSELDPNVLNFYVLLDPAQAVALAAGVTAASVALSVAISRNYFRSYNFAGFGYLLGLPVGFAFLAASYLFELASRLFSADPTLYPAFFWLQMLLQAEAFALVALSYYYKAGTVSRGRLAAKIAITAVPVVMVAIPLLIPASVIVANPYLNYAGLADLNFYLRIYNLALLAFVFRSALASLVKSGSVRTLYVPGAFALIALEQYSLVVAYFDNSTVAFVGSLAARLAGLAVFAYTVRLVTSRRRIEIEAGKAA